MSILDEITLILGNFGINKQTFSRVVLILTFFLAPPAFFRAPHFPPKIWRLAPPLVTPRLLFRGENLGLKIFK